MNFIIHHHGAIFTLGLALVAIMQTIRHARICNRRKALMAELRLLHADMSLPEAKSRAHPYYRTLLCDMLQRHR